MPTNCQGLTRILLQSLWPSGVHPQVLLGKFAGDELTLCVAPDMDKDWNRRPGESGADFEHRIACDIREARGLPRLPPVEEIEEDLEESAQAPRRSNQPPRHIGPRRVVAASGA